MLFVRRYGHEPYKIVLLHGGPGGGGELRLVANTLYNRGWSVLEPILRGKSIKVQLRELANMIRGESAGKVIVIGHSWGAMLGWLLSGKYPELVEKLFLIASGEFNPDFVSQITKTRNKRMTVKEKKMYQLFTDKKFDNELFKKIGKFLTKIDSCCLIDDKFKNDIEPDYKVFESIWSDLEKLRDSGDFLEVGKRIGCPIVVVHGDFDPHPVEGIVEPIKSLTDDVKVYVLKRCGHYPWREKYAMDDFYKILLKELGD